jgi:metal-responsive CopG/Arc/MetJ family transcriptional regulator
MTSAKISISLTPELAAALDALAKRRGEDRSRVVETLLREHPYVLQEVRVQRSLGQDAADRVPGRDDGRPRVALRADV